MAVPLHVHLAVDGDPRSITPRPGVSGDPFRTALEPLVDGWTVLTRGPADRIPTDAVVMVGSRIDPDVLRSRPSLRAIIVPWAGIPIALQEALVEADRTDIEILNVHHNAPSAAETAVGLLLAAARGIHALDADLRRHDWRQRYEPRPSRRLEGGRALVVGRGWIGSRIARALDGLGMIVESVGRPASGPRWTPEALASIAAGVDALLVAVPGSPDTEGMIDATVLDAIPGAILVNVGRASVIDEDALFERLRNGRLFAAGLDVWWRVPGSESERSATAPSAHPFHELDNVVMTPHVGGGLGEPGIESARAEAIAEVLRSLTGNP
ncbi:MAG: hypothetical protein CMJ34_14515 [Phycisphaerae bacterium]|nr:hypothetical protein [Phycisphaerae bacterium]